MEQTGRLHSAFVAVALLGLLGPAARADHWAVTRGPSHEPDRFRYDAAKPPVVPAEFLEDAAACVLYAGTSYLVEPDGQVEVVTHEVTRLNGRKGVEKLGEYRNIAYDPSYQKLTLNEGRIHKAGGRTVAIEPRHVQLRDVATDFQVYDHEKQLILSFPSLEVGDVIEVKWTVRGRNPEHGGRFFTNYTFGDPQFPVLTDELRVRLPREMPFRHAVAGGTVKPALRDEGGYRLFTWKATHCRRLPQDENLPPHEDLRLAVACSTFASWEEVACWKQHLRADSWKCTDEVRKVVAEIVHGLSDPVARARALTYWLRQKVRYVSVGEKHDYTPHPPAEVLANRFGDCKDTSQLLAVMLREAGVSVELATLGALDDGQVMSEVPSPWGTHAIVLATIDGKEHWIDTTATLASWDYLPREDRGRLCYLVDDRGRLRLRRPPDAVASDYRVDQTTEVWVGPDGTSRCRRVAAYEGMAAMGQRDNLLEVPAGERRRLVAAELQDANSRARLLELSVDEAALHDFDRPVTVRVVFEIPGHFSGTPDLEGSVSDSKVWGRLLACNLDYERTVGLNLGGPCELSHRYVVHLPPGCTVEEVPADRRVRSRWGSFSRRILAADGGRDLEVVFRTRIDQAIIDPANFDEFRRFHEDVANAFRAWLTLKPVTEIAAAPLLEAVTKFAGEDTASATALARLYEGAGREANVRRVLRRAVFYRPEQVGLWELLAQSTSDAAEREALQREMVRRFPEDGRRALELAALLVGQGRQTEARCLLQPLAAKGPAALRAQARYQLARSCSRRDELEGALEHLQAAEEADPEALHTVPALLLRGNTLEELGRRAEAIEAYEAVLALDHNAEGALAGLVRLALAAGKRDEAVDHLRRYTVAVGNDPAGLLEAADFHLQLRRWDDALDLARRAGDKAPAGRANRILGLVYWHRGDAGRAAHHLALGDRDASVVAALLKADVARGKLDRVPELLRWAEGAKHPAADLTRATECGRAILRRRAELAGQAAAPAGKSHEWAEAVDACACAEAEYAAGAHAAAESLVESVLERDPVPPAALAVRGRIALDRGRLMRALADAERCLRTDSSCGTAYYVRGRVRLERGDSGALEDLRRAAELTGRTDAAVLSALAEALFAVGRREEAIDTQRQAVKLRPRDRQLAEELSRFENAAAPSRGGSDR
jgi:tetratricopeptide (TPR) repeat protein